MKFSLPSSETIGEYMAGGVLAFVASFATVELLHGYNIDKKLNTLTKQIPAAKADSYNAALQDYCAEPVGQISDSAHEPTIQEIKELFDTNELTFDTQMITAFSNNLASQKKQLPRSVDTQAPNIKSAFSAPQHISDGN